MKALAMHPGRIQSAVIGGMGWMPDRGPGPIRIQGPREQADTTSDRACFKGFGELTLTREELTSVKTPMTVIVGAEDPIYERFVKPLQEVRSDVPVIVVPSANHINCIMRPELKNGMTQFLAAHGGGK
jgi:pimeloyl-ACP methyl ester carboxylesterase